MKTSQSPPSHRPSGNDPLSPTERLACALEKGKARERKVAAEEARYQRVKKAAKSAYGTACTPTSDNVALSETQR